MKTTGYCRSLAGREDRRGIKAEWIRRVVDFPEMQHIQADGRIRRWWRVPAMGDRYLRVVLLEDGETVHNAFFDRGVKA